MDNFESNVGGQIDTQDVAIVNELVQAEADLVKRGEEVAKYLASVKEAEKRVDDLREKVKVILQNTRCFDENEKEVAPFIKNDFVKFTLIRGFNKKTIDVKRIETMDRKLYDKLIEKFPKTQSRKDSVRVDFLKKKVESL